MISLYNTIIYQPLFNALIFFYQTIAFHDLGWAIIFLTILIRIILFPVFHKSARHQIIMQRLQPHVKKIQIAHKANKEKQAQELMALYKENKINPFSGFLMLIIQLPILWALYQISMNILKPASLTGFYSFISAPISLNTYFLGLINLANGSILMVGLAAAAQYFQAKLSLPKNKAKDESPGIAEKMTRQMVFVAPLLTLLIFYRLPAAISLYWLVASLFSIFQQIIINRQLEDGKLGNGNK